MSSLTQTISTLLITLIIVAGIAASSFFGFLSNNKKLSLSAATVTSMIGICLAFSTFLLWGLAKRDSTVLLVLFAVTFGFFANGYCATWGGVLDEIEKDAAQANETIDIGVIYGLLNGARGIGYIGGGLISMLLIKTGSEVSVGGFGYGAVYGPLILFTGLSLGFGGWVVVWKWKKALQLIQ